MKILVLLYALGGALTVHWITRVWGAGELWSWADRVMALLCWPLVWLGALLMWLLEEIGGE